MEEKEEIKEYFKSLLDSRKFLIKTILSDININLEFENGSYNIALYSEYGSGKSYFLNSLKEFISDEKLRTSENFDLDTNFKIIEINAWKDDFLNDPILSIGFALKKEIEEDGSSEVIEKFDNFLNKTISMKKGFPMLLKWTASGIAEVFGLKGIFDHIVDDIKEAQPKDYLNTIDSITNYSDYKNCLEKIKKDLEEYIKKFGAKKLLIIVDELDRCRPDYSVEFLEAINHIFDVKGMVFLFAIDKNALKSAMTTVYGTEMNFDNYIKKFIHTNFSLNKLSKEDNKYFMEKLFLSKSLKIDCEKDILDVFYNMATSFDMNLREIECSFRIFKYLYGRIEKIYNYKNNKDFIIIVAMFLSLLKSKYPVQYYKLFNQKTLDTNLKITDINLDVLDEIFNLVRNINGFCIKVNINIENINNLFKVLFFASFKYDKDYGFGNNFDNDLYNLMKPEHEDLIIKIFSKNYKIEDRNNQNSFYMVMHNLFKIPAKPLTDENGSILKKIYNLIC